MHSTPTWEYQGTSCPWPFSFIGSHYGLCARYLREVSRNEPRVPLLLLGSLHGLCARYPCEGVPRNDPCVPLLLLGSRYGLCARYLRRSIEERAVRASLLLYKLRFRLLYFLAFLSRTYIYEHVGGVRIVSLRANQKMDEYFRTRRHSASFAPFSTVGATEISSSS